MKEAIVERLSKLEDVIVKFSDVIENEADDLRNEHGIISAQEMREHLAELYDEDRLLNIGIIGKVKAGKSSLLNAIFFNGKDILPTAATPMTAALTVMEYGETLSATVDYFSEADIENIKRKHAAYNAKWAERHDAIKAEIAERAKKRGLSPNFEAAEKQTNNEMKENSNFAAYDQYERIRKSGMTHPGEESKRLSASSPENLLGMLDEYVGANGKMMPFTKSVKMEIDTEALRDICVVDTPGLNDPVESREQRTKEYLKKCTVVFIIIQAGEFLSADDVSLTRRLFEKEGAQKAYFVASQADEELITNVGRDTEWNLIEARKKLCADLSAHTKNVLSSMKQKSPEIAKKLDERINDEDSVIITSAFCHNMLLNYDKRNSWDSAMSHTWERLKKHYRDFFDNDNSAKASLELLSGVNTVAAKIDLAKQEKDALNAGKRDEYVKQQSPNIDKFLQELTEEVKRKSGNLKDADMALIKEKKQKMELLVSRGTEAVDGAYEDCLGDFISETRWTIAEKSKEFFRILKDSITGEEVDVEKEKEVPAPTIGFGFLQALGILPDTEIITVKERGLRAGAVTSMVNELAPNLRELLTETVEKEKRNWRQDVQAKVIGALREASGDSDDIDPFTLKAAIRQVVNNMKLPELDLGEYMFRSSHSGIIDGNAIESFLAEVGEYLSSLRIASNKERDEFLSAVEESAKREKMSTMLFSKLDEQLKSLEQDIQNKELVLARLQKCTDALETIA